MNHYSVSNNDFMYCNFSFCLYAYCMLFVVVRNKGKFAAYNWLRISCINTILLIKSSLLLLFLFLTSYNLQTLNVLCNFIISVCLVMNLESFSFLRFLFHVFHFAFLVFHVCKFNIIIN